LIAGLKIIGNGLAKRNEVINSQNIEYLFRIDAIDIRVSFPRLATQGEKCHFSSQAGTEHNGR
jgi:hypothetical protein